MSRHFECRVGGIAFPTTIETLVSYPDSFFQVSLSETWNASGSNFIVIDRDGTHFQYILDYLRYGYLPRDSCGRCNIPNEVLDALAVEADFYGLTSLVKEVEELLKYKSNGMRFFISKVSLNSGRGGGLWLKEYATFDVKLKKFMKISNKKILLKTIVVLIKLISMESKLIKAETKVLDKI